MKALITFKHNEDGKNGRDTLKTILINNNIDFDEVSYSIILNIVEFTFNNEEIKYYVLTTNDINIFLNDDNINSLVIH